MLKNRVRGGCPLLMMQTECPQMAGVKGVESFPSGSAG